MQYSIPIIISWDEDAKEWYAVGDDIGLALESDSYDELIRRICVVAPEMADLNSVAYTELEIVTKKRKIKEH